MITRVIVIKLKPNSPVTDIQQVLARLHTLRQEYSGIFSLEAGEVFEGSKDWLKDPPDQDKYCAVLRFVEPYFFARFSLSDTYLSIMDDLRSLSSEVMTWDINGQEVAGPPSALPSYGNFSASVEDRLKVLFRLWFQGDGTSLTLDTLLYDLPGDVFEADLVQFGKAIEVEFGLKNALDILASGKVNTLGDLVLRIENHLRHDQRA